MNNNEKQKKLQKGITALTELILKKEEKINKLRQEILFLDNEILDLLYLYQMDFEDNKIAE